MQSDRGAVRILLGLCGMGAVWQLVRPPIPPAGLLAAPGRLVGAGPVDGALVEH